jgi:hypothetical protein
VDEACDMVKAIKIAVDAKVDYPAACNAMETLLVHEALKTDGRYDQLTSALTAAGVVRFTLLLFPSPRIELTNTRTHMPTLARRVVLAQLPLFHLRTSTSHEYEVTTRDLKGDMRRVHRTRDTGGIHLAPHAPRLVAHSRLAGSGDV